MSSGAGGMEGVGGFEGVGRGGGLGGSGHVGTSSQETRSSLGLFGQLIGTTPFTVMDTMGPVPRRQDESPPPASEVFMTPRAPASDTATEAPWGDGHAPDGAASSARSGAPGRGVSSSFGPLGHAHEGGGAQGLPAEAVSASASPGGGDGGACVDAAMAMPSVASPSDPLVEASLGAEYMQGISEHGEDTTSEVDDGLFLSETLQEDEAAEADDQGDEAVGASSGSPPAAGPVTDPVGATHSEQGGEGASGDDAKEGPSEDGDVAMADVPGDDDGSEAGGDGAGHDDGPGEGGVVHCHGGQAPRVVAYPSHAIAGLRGLRVAHVFDLHNPEGVVEGQVELEGLVVEEFTDMALGANVACIFADGEQAELTRDEAMVDTDRFRPTREDPPYPAFHDTVPFVVVLRLYGDEQASHAEVVQACARFGGFAPDAWVGLEVQHWEGPSVLDLDAYPLTLPCARLVSGVTEPVVGMCLGAEVTDGDGDPPNSIEDGYVVMWADLQVDMDASRQQVHGWAEAFVQIGGLRPISVVVMPH